MEPLCAQNMSAPNCWTPWFPTPAVYWIVSSDREHFANLAYLTGFDPRFEEALLILTQDQTPTLLVGNEDMAYTAISPIDLRPVLFQTFSLLSQPRSSSAPLTTILRDAGVGLTGGKRVGITGWKYFIPVDVIPATNTPYYTTNIEDGIALADEALRQAFEQKYPDAWGRIQQRRAFMHNMLGIRLKPELLPFSNIPAYLPPFWLSPQLAMRVAYL